MCEADKGRRRGEKHKSQIRHRNEQMGGTVQCGAAIEVKQRVMFSSSLVWIRILTFMSRLSSSFPFPLLALSNSAIRPKIQKSKGGLGKLNTHRLWHVKSWCRKCMISPCYLFHCLLQYFCTASLKNHFSAAALSLPKRFGFVWKTPLCLAAFYYCYTKCLLKNIKHVLCQGKGKKESLLLWLAASLIRDKS